MESCLSLAAERQLLFRAFSGAQESPACLAVGGAGTAGMTAIFRKPQENKGGRAASASFV